MAAQLATSTNPALRAAFPTGRTALPTRRCLSRTIWKVGSRLTLNLGLRWDYMGWPVDAFGRRGNFDYYLYQPPPVGGSTSDGFVQSSTARDPLAGIPKVNPTLINYAPDKNFAPRFGFADKLRSKLALRGGYGIFYDRLSNQLGLSLRNRRRITLGPRLRAPRMRACACPTKAFRQLD
jgi:hypothetical protein